MTEQNLIPDDADDTEALSKHAKVWLGTVGALVLSMGIYLMGRTAKTRRGM